MVTDGCGKGLCFRHQLEKNTHVPRRSFHLFCACGRKSRETTALSANKIFFPALKRIALHRKPWSVAAVGWSFLESIRATLETCVATRSWVQSVMQMFMMEMLRAQQA